MYAELELKTCLHCKEEKSLSEFRFRKDKNCYVNPCKKCATIDAKKWAISNPERRAFLTFRKDLKRFGLTLESYEVLKASQNSKCANKACLAEKSICGRRLAIDHCHATKIVRGLLCNECNTALGLLMENEDKILGILDYIRKFKN